MGSRIIMHLDMDCFFAAVEEKKNPQLKGKPVIVGADPKQGLGRGVVSTCNYEARRFGVRSGMPISKAWQLCQYATYCPVDFPAYMQASSHIMGIIRKHAPKMEQVGIDEAYMDASFCESFDKAKELAASIKADIFSQQRLTCSIGIGPNKLVAKIATDMRKPDGITAVKEREVEQKLWPLPANRLPGIGKKTESILSAIGLRTIGDIAKSDVNRLIDLFGKGGYEICMMARGADEREIEDYYEPKSISREITFDADLEDRGLILQAIDGLSKDIHGSVTEEGYFYRSVGIKIRFSTFETHTRIRTIKASADLDTIRSTALELMAPFLDGKKRIRLIGIRVGGLVERGGIRTLGEFVQG